jgi:ribonuclease PH
VSEVSRKNGRSATSLRPIEIIPGVNPYAEGSAEVSFGDTKVLVAATVELEIPRWKEPGSGGWITAEYGMLPRSTHTRNRREAASGKQGGRTQEIQRLIGRSLRQAVALENLGDLTIRLDCDVLQADGGTRTASITGAWVALHQALKWCKENAHIDRLVEVDQVAALSLGLVDGRPLVDLDYQEDTTADFDLNLVFSSSGRLIEIQGTGEKRAVSAEELQHLISLGLNAARELFAKQTEVIGAE